MNTESVLRALFIFHQSPLFFLSFKQMETYERRKKSDKAKDKAGRYTTKHVRATEALIEKAKARPNSRK
jgi:hypothetical protein